MDSLLANYASSDEEEQKQHSKPLVSKSEAEEEQDFPSKSTSRPGGIFSSLPPPKSSLFNSLPPPKSQSFPDPEPPTNYVQQDEQIDDHVRENSKPKASSSSLFSSLPTPKSSTSASSSTTSKKVVQFRPPPMINLFSSGVNDEDEDEDEEERQRKKSKASLSTSAMSFLSSMPAPKNSATLGAMPSALGSGRRCIIESEARDSTESVTGSDKVVSSNVGFLNDQSDEMNYDNSSWSLGSESSKSYSAVESFHGENVASAVVSSVMENDGDGVNSNLGSSEVKSDELNYDYSGRISGTESYYNHHNGGKFVSVGPEAVDYSYGDEDNSDYPNYAAGYGYYSSNPQNENNWADTSIMTAFPEASGGVENTLNIYGKRGRRDAPQDIVEVKQDELMKNRPREDQTKMTGIAFGPAYQPTSTKGKPSKLHKRKHQIGSLLFDMKQKEMELAERRSKGYATKAQTQAKYGW
ncbi:uncharacterized protein [Primulina huaijiensis]|uniref:uncharacterized protein n=1 Tax=Primulina huaijiensis TaxID=1492673 RepID=UPI003CC6E2F5